MPRRSQYAPSSQTCIDGKPHYRITGNLYIASRYPDFFDTHVDRMGYEWQLCINCGDAFEANTGSVLVPEDSPGLVRPPKIKPPGSHNMQPKPIMDEYPGYVSTQAAATRLGVQRAQIREYLRGGLLEGRQIIHRGCPAYLVSVESLGRRIAEKYGVEGEDLVANIIAGLQTSGTSEKPQEGRYHD